MLLVCFEDDAVADLSPITLARPAYAIRCASFRLIDWLHELVDDDGKSKCVGVVRPHLSDLQELDYKLQSPSGNALDDPISKSGVLLVNARLVPSVQTYQTLRSLIQQTRCTIIGDETVLAAWLPAADVDAASKNSATKNWNGWLEYATAKGHRESATLDLFQWPHEVVSHHMRSMADSANWRVEHGNYQQLQDGVFVGSGVTIGQYAAIQTNNGPIILEDNVKVGPFCLLDGPIHAGHSTRIIEHSALKDGVSLGHTVKIGGEVEASVIEPYSNKQHHGFLGHSYLGSWINLGAGTCNSDLKNTYGKINIEYGDKKIATGMQFLGCIMGDYSKSAINTGIFTGKVIGVCSMMYGFVTSNVASYVNYARLFGQTSLLPPDVMVNTQARMFARRKVQQRPCDIELINAMYDLTAKERETDF